VTYLLPLTTTDDTETDEDETVYGIEMMTNENFYTLETVHPSCVITDYNMFTDAALETAYAGKNVTITGDTMRIDLKTTSMTEVYLTAKTRGQVEADTKQLTFAVCQLPLVEMTDGAAIEETYDGQSGDANNINVITTLSDLISAHECGLCSPTYRVIDGEGVEVDTKVTVNEDRNILIDTSVGFTLSGNLQVFYAEDQDPICSSTQAAVDLKLDIHVCGQETINTPDEALVYLLAWVENPATDEERYKILPMLEDTDYFEVVE
jgi:hypothetical protein